MGHWFLGCSEHFGGGVNPKIPPLAWCHPAIFNSYIYNSWSIEIAVMKKISGPLWSICGFDPVKAFLWS